MANGDIIVGLVTRNFGESAESVTMGELVQSDLGSTALALIRAGGDEEEDKSGESEDVEMVDDRFDREKPLMIEERFVVSVCSLFEPGCELKKERIDSRCGELTDDMVEKVRA